MFIKPTAFTILFIYFFTVVSSTKLRGKYKKKTLNNKLLTILHLRTDREQ